MRNEQTRGDSSRRVRIEIDLLTEQSQYYVTGGSQGKGTSKFQWL